MNEPARKPDVTLWAAARRSVRVRMLLIALLPLLIVLPLLLVTAVKSWTTRFNEVLIAKVHTELTIANQHLAGLLANRGAAIEALAASAAFQATPLAEREMFLETARKKLGFDFLYFTTKAKGWPVIAGALAGHTQSAIDIFEAEDLAAISPLLAARAQISLVDTKAAVATDRLGESRGMLVHAAAQAPGGALVGGVLLNRNLDFIDQMNELVYPSGSLTEGTATLFLEDVRISTNVRLFEDVRAIGTRVSAAVRARVLDEGRIWLDRAFVVNDWYVSAYEPIIDSFGKRVGMLYVGFLEAGFTETKRRTLYQIALTFLVVVLFSAPVLLRWARGIFKPLERIDGVIRAVEKGDLGARVNLAAKQDEISRVAAHLDILLDQLQEREKRLRDWADVLESRVAERTADLAAANLQLEQTTRQLILSEKLAAIGEITAGVAHEINNPLAVIQGNFDVVRDDLGPRGDSLRTEFTLIQEQIQAIHILVTKLLRFARPEEYADAGSGFDPNALVQETLPLVQHLLGGAGIDLALDLQARGMVAMNQTELQQVLVNLMVNAIQAMPEGGSLQISTQDADAATVRIEVRDSGRGIAPEVLPRIFDPFFTTKKALGTGLGLSISKTLITRAGGRIEATSEPGQGSCFVIDLPMIQA
ncbi:ATP-binding protein [Pseudorhodobacter sp. E13]|uniref:sensor histidine kinase n=1 Tax=Pseudorhodobacter sp. E13 TaxID=2487931 RepID=UPI0018F3546C|nr:ATP-binding protein [Pseudorhodobacter sp. E13]